MKNSDTMFKTWLQRLKRLPNNIAIGLIVLYRKIFSPTVGVLRFIPLYFKPSCVFYPTCSEYGLLVFKKYPFLMACKKTITRISRCHPGTGYTVDMP